MSVTINTLGTNSRQIVVSNESDNDGFINAISTAVTALGWTLYDTVSSGSRNCLVTKVYSANNADDNVSPSVKYMILRYDSPRQCVYLSCAESWNTSTNVPTNECWDGAKAFPMPLQPSNMIYYVFATARYCVFAPYLRGTPGPWQGVFEFERGEMYDDTSTGSPCFGYTNGLVLGSPLGTTFNSETTSSTAQYGYDQAMNNFYCLWLPRTKNGYTGREAAKQHNVRTAFQDFPPALAANVTTLDYYSDKTGLGLAGLKASYSANDALRPVYSLKPGTQNPTDYIAFGRIYGLKAVPHFTDNQLDIINVPINSNGFFSNSGTNTAHYALGLSGGVSAHFGCAHRQASSAETVGQMALTQRLVATPIPQYYVNGANTTQYTTLFMKFVKGSTLYHVCANTTADTSSSDVLKFNFDSFTWKYVYSLPSKAMDLCFDGNNYLYIPCKNTCVRIDISNNDSVTLIANGFANGYFAATTDDTYLYLTQRTPTVNTVIDLVNLSTFTVSNTLTKNLTNFGATLSINNFLDSGKYDGWIYGSIVSASTAANSLFIYKLSANGQVASNTRDNGGTGTFGANYGKRSHLHYTDSNIFTVIYGIANNNGVVSCAHNPDTLVRNDIRLSLWSNSTSGTYDTGGTDARAYADNPVVNYRGYNWLISYNYSGTSSQSMLRNTVANFSAVNVNISSTVLINNTYTKGIFYSDANGFSLGIGTWNNPAIVSDGVFLYVANSTAFSRRYYQSSEMYNNWGSPTAHVIIPQ